MSCGSALNAPFKALELFVDEQLGHSAFLHSDPTARQDEAAVSTPIQMSDG